MRKIVLLLLCLMAFSSSAFASGWQDDIKAIAETQKAGVLYEVYHGMPWDDFESAWQDVPGWRRINDEVDHHGFHHVLLEKQGKDADGVTQEFAIVSDDMGTGNVGLATLRFTAPDEKTADRIYAFILEQFRSNLGKNNAKLPSRDPFTQKTHTTLVWIKGDKAYEVNHKPNAPTMVEISCHRNEKYYHRDIY